jgi:hypothetical protein
MNYLHVWLGAVLLLETVEMYSPVYFLSVAQKGR